MAYIGNPPAERFTSFDYQDLTGGTGTSFTLTHPVGNAQEILVMVNNVVQEPGVAYTVSGTALTMTGSIVAADDFYVVYRGKAIQTATHPSDRALTATDGTFTGDASVTGDLTVDTDTLVVDAANNRVGVAQSTPDAELHIGDGSGSSDNTRLRITGGTSGLSTIQFGDTASANIGQLQYDHSSNFLAVRVNAAERARFLSSGGLTFNGDTAAANALDDYEEGTWTPAVSTASTTHTATGIYTKVGNIVSIQCVIHFTQSGTTFGSISGLPFVVASVNYTPLAFREWYSTGVALFGNLVIGAQSTSGFRNSANSTTAVSGQQYGFALQAVYRT
tara:strand:- start:2325 stop:3323 length:999 start_codon:yes stop_codon:yes gene_type:complete